MDRRADPGLESGGPAAGPRCSTAITIASASWRRRPAAEAPASDDNRRRRWRAAPTTPSHARAVSRDPVSDARPRRRRAAALAPGALSWPHVRPAGGDTLTRGRARRGGDRTHDDRRRALRRRSGEASGPTWRSTAATDHLTDTKTRRFFFDRSYLAVQPGTTGYKVTSAGAAPQRQRRHAGPGPTRCSGSTSGNSSAAGETRTFADPLRHRRPGRRRRPGRSGSATSLVDVQRVGLRRATGRRAAPSPSSSRAGYAVESSAAALGKPTTDAAGNTVLTRPAAWRTR